MEKVTIRTKLIGGMLLLVCMMCSGLSYIAYGRAKQAALIQVDENIIAVARYGGDLARKRLDYHVAVLQGIANRNAIRSMDWNQQRPALENEIARMKYLGMGIVDPDGLARYSDESSANLNDREYFRQALVGRTTFSSVIISKVTSKPVIMVATPIMDNASVIRGVLIARLDANLLSDITDGIKFGQNGYSYIVDGNGALIAHANRQFVLDQRNFIEEGKTNSDFADVAKMLHRMTKGEAGFEQYPFMGKDRFFGFAPIESTGWSIAVGGYAEEILAPIHEMRWMIGLASLVFFVVGIGVALLIARVVLSPVTACANLLKEISEGDGDLAKRLPVETNDEIGQLCRHFNKFVTKLQIIIAGIADNARFVASSAKELSAVSSQTTQSVRSLSSKTSTVAAASEEMSSNIASVAAGMEQATLNLSSVAAATEEMTATIGEIAGSTERASITTEGAAQEMDSFASVLRQLGEAAQEIGKVTQTISAISSQTNLLALNATIEAARAGVAGRGFAVVANEIKELALKTAEATSEIGGRIEGIQSATGSAVSDIDRIVKIIGEVNSIVANIAAAIEEQSVVTREVANNVAQATLDVKDANTRSMEMSTVSRDVAKDINSVDVITNDIRSGGEQVQASAEKLSRLAENLNVLVGQFKI
ncbi:methyl-accepting chemotaxis protein [Desulfomicrobium salsuginis]